MAKNRCRLKRQDCDFGNLQAKLNGVKTAWLFYLKFKKLFYQRQLVIAELSGSKSEGLI